MGAVVAAIAIEGDETVKAAAVDAAGATGIATGADVAAPGQAAETEIVTGIADATGIGIAAGIGIGTASVTATAASTVSGAAIVPARPTTDG